MKILHVVPGLNEKGNGIAVAAKLIAQEQAKSGVEVEVVETREFVSSSLQSSTFSLQPLSAYAEIWVHSMWLPQTMRACWKVLKEKEKGKRKKEKGKGERGDSACAMSLVRMTHANLDPVRLAYHGWKKRLVGPIERWLFSKTNRVVVTCAAEKAWCERWGLKNEFEVVDLKRFFRLGGEGEEVHGAHFSEAERIPLLHWGRPQHLGRLLRVLYLGRRHPLKGVEYLERAVEELNGEAESFPLQKKGEPSLLRSGRDSASPLVQLRIVSDHFGEELEKDWAWCDVLCLPTLSENFGLVVAEALERGKRVVTTDGAPAWEPDKGDESKREKGKVKKNGGQLLYLRGYRDGTDEERVKLLKDALGRGLAQNSV